MKINGRNALRSKVLLRLVSRGQRKEHTSREMKYLIFRFGACLCLRDGNIINQVFLYVARHDRVRQHFALKGSVMCLTLFIYLFTT